MNYQLLKCLFIAHVFYLIDYGSNQSLCTCLIHRNGYWLFSILIERNHSCRIDQKYEKERLLNLPRNSSTINESFVIINGIPILLLIALIDKLLLLDQVDFRNCRFDTVPRIQKKSNTRVFVSNSEMFTELKWLLSLSKIFSCFLDYRRVEWWKWDGRKAKFA